MGWISILLALIQLTPDILKLILQVEQIIGAGKGSVKKAIVMAPMAAAVATDPNAKNADKVMAGVSNIIDSQVSSLNSSGVFTKG